jgi:hypothetical protein
MWAQRNISDISALLLPLDFHSVNAVLKSAAQGCLFRQNMTFANGASDAEDIWINELYVGAVSAVWQGISQHIFKVNYLLRSSCTVSVIVRFKQELRCVNKF